MTRYLNRYDRRLGDIYGTIEKRSVSEDATTDETRLVLHGGGSRDSYLTVDELPLALPLAPWLGLECRVFESS